MKRGVSLEDVAALAGVSVTTASRALNGAGRVSEATRARVFEVAERLSFKPNALAQSFATGRSGVVGLIIEAPKTFTVPVLVGATTALGRRGMAALAFDAHENREDRGEAIRALNARQVDGVLVIGHAAPYLDPELFAALDAPTVFVYGVRASDQTATFRTDGFGAGRIAGEHLIGLGRRRIAHITAAADPSAAQRAAGLGAALQDHGLTMAGGAPITGEWDRKTGVEGMRHLLENAGQIDAVFCGNDQIAWGAYSALRVRGIAVPDDIALIGYDRWNTLLDSQNKFLTTIDPNLGVLGSVAADSLVESIRSGKQESGVYSVPPTLIPGVSTLGRQGFDSAALMEGDDDDLSLQAWISKI